MFLSLSNSSNAPDLTNPSNCSLLTSLMFTLLSKSMNDDYENLLEAQNNYYLLVKERMKILKMSTADTKICKYKMQTQFMGSQMFILSKSDPRVLVEASRISVQVFVGWNEVIWKTIASIAI